MLGGHSYTALIVIYSYISTVEMWILGAIVKVLNSVLCPSCPYCDRNHLEEDAVAVRCLDCGMGKYKEGRHKDYRKPLHKDGFSWSV